jgi:transcriptional repressor NrdR
MTEVIKRNGSREPFEPEKIRRSVKKAAVDSGSSLETKKDVIDRISNYTISVAEQKDEIETKEIRERVLEEMDKLEPSISGAWRKFDRKYKSIQT